MTGIAGQEPPSVVALEAPVGGPRQSRLDQRDDPEPGFLVANPIEPVGKFAALFATGS
jgi:hypothetical protein